MENNQSPAPTFSPGENEHAQNRLRRVDQQLHMFAELTTSSEKGNRAECVAQELVTGLAVRACIIQGIDIENELKTIALSQQEDLSGSEHSIKQIATLAAADVIGARKPVIIPNLAAHYPNERWIGQTGISSYLGAPLLDSSKIMIGVAAVMGGSTRQFREEDELWLRIVTQSVTDALSREVLEAKLQAAMQLGGATEEIDPESRPTEKVRQPSVLLVDDDEAVNRVLCRFLKEEGFRVESVCDGVEAMRIFQPTQHDMVLTDIMMPNMNGWELVAALHARAPGVPFLIMSGYNNGEWNDTYLRKQGIVAVLNKPLDLFRLANLLREHCPESTA